MSETLASQTQKDITKDAKLEEKVENNSSGASKKSKKSKNATTTPTPDNGDIQKMIEERLKALGASESIEDDQEWKSMKKKYKTLSKLTVTSFYPQLSNEEKLKKLVEAYTALANISNSFEEHTYILSKTNPNARMERDNYHGDNVRQGQIKTELEKACREIQKNNTTIKDFNKKFVSEETKKREELIGNFENTINEVTEKMNAQKVAAEEFAVENAKLREELTGKIQKFEEREKEFFDQLKGIDDQNDSKTKGILSKLKEIETHAKKTFEIKDEIQKIKARETENKFKVAIYSQRAPDFDRTLISTKDMLSRFKLELEKTGQKMRNLLKVNKELKAKTQNVDGAVLKMVVLNQEIKDKFEKSRKEKDEVRAKLKVLQDDINAKKKLLEEKLKAASS